MQDSLIHEAEAASFILLVAAFDRDLAARHVPEAARDGCSLAVLKLFGYANKAVPSLTPEDIQGYLSSVHVRATIQAATARALREFFQWAMREDIVESDPTDLAIVDALIDEPRVFLPVHLRL